MKGRTDRHIDRKGVVGKTSLAVTKVSSNYEQTMTCKTWQARVISTVSGTRSKQTDKRADRHTDRHAQILQGTANR